MGKISEMAQMDSDVVVPTNGLTDYFGQNGFAF